LFLQVSISLDGHRISSGLLRLNRAAVCPLYLHTLSSAFGPASVGAVLTDAALRPVLVPLHQCPFQNLASCIIVLSSFDKILDLTLRD
jgi:hypothetical protein